MDREHLAVYIQSFIFLVLPVLVPGVPNYAAGGVVVAHVRMDDGTYDCNDSCIYANDNQCDEDQVRRFRYLRVETPMLKIAYFRVTSFDRSVPRRTSLILR